MQAKRRRLTDVAIFLAVRARPTGFGFSLWKGVVRANFHAVPVGRQVLEVRALCARLPVDASPAVSGTLRAGIPDLCIAHLVVANRAFRLTPEVWVQVHGVLALGAGACILAFVAVPWADRAFVADRLAVKRPVEVTFWARYHALGIGIEIQVVLALRRIGGGDALVEVVRALHALPTILLVANLVVPVRAMLDAFARTCEEVGAVADLAGDVALALEAVLRAGEALAADHLSAILIVGVRARVGAGRAVRPVREEPALRTFCVAVAGAAVLVALFARSAQPIIPLLAFHLVVALGTLGNALEVMREIVLVLALETGRRVHAGVAILVALGAIATYAVPAIRRIVAVRALGGTVVRSS